MAKQKSTAVLAARQHANELRKEEARRLRRRRALIQAGIITAAVVVVAVIVFAVAFGSRGGGSAARPTTAPPPQSPTATSPVSVGADFVRHGAEDAPVTVALYEDYSCPHCQDYEALIGDTLTDLVESGDVAVQYHPVRIVTNYGNRAGSAAACVAEGDPTSWPEVHTSLFAIHTSETDGWSNTQLRDHISSLGVSHSSVLDCIAEGRFENWIDDNTAAARDAGVNATPTLTINGQTTQTLDPAALRAAVAQAISAG